MVEFFKDNKGLEREYNVQTEVVPNDTAAASIFEI
jgi:hypothetical protein